jgi:cytoskeletal protein CcmA (bactofilin family)
MAIFGKDDRPQRPEPTGPTKFGGPLERPLDAPPRVEEATQAHLGKGSRIDGRLMFEGSVKIDGHVEGDIQAQQTIIIGENASIAAQITAETVVIKGKVTGDISARKLVELRAPARLIGNITTPSLVIHEGVLFEGHCSMGGAESKGEKLDKKVALFPKEERSTTGSLRIPTEAVK